MKFLVTPRREFAGTFKVPGDKSISHRAVMFAAIAEGESRIQGFLEGEDCLATLNAFAAMGVQSQRLDNGDVLVQGVGKHGLKAPANSSVCVLSSIETMARSIPSLISSSKPST